MRLALAAVAAAVAVTAAAGAAGLPKDATSEAWLKRVCAPGAKNNEQCVLYMWGALDTLTTMYPGRYCIRDGQQIADAMQNYLSTHKPLTMPTSAGTVIAAIAYDVRCPTDSPPVATASPPQHRRAGWYRPACSTYQSFWDRLRGHGFHERCD